MIAFGLLSLLVLAVGGPAGASSHAHASAKPTIVLVHGDWADASSWTNVMKRLQGDGFTVVAPPNLLKGPDIDAPYLASYLKSITGPIVLVAHSYGGFVATNAATGNDNVKALVYVDAFAPDQGETAGELVARGNSCVGGDALNQVPYGGGVDLCLRWDANVPRGTHWTRPELVAQIGFAEWTPEGRLRQPRFLGLRDDKHPADVVRELAG
jgi:pimeloyl-ACP methyl ester carboxylesterase